LNEYAATNKGTQKNQSKATSNANSKIIQTIVEIKKYPFAVDLLLGDPYYMEEINRMGFFNEQMPSILDKIRTQINRP